MPSTLATAEQIFVRGERDRRPDVRYPERAVIAPFLPSAPEHRGGVGGDRLPPGSGPAGEPGPRRDGTAASEGHWATTSWRPALSSGWGWAGCSPGPAQACGRPSSPRGLTRGSRRAHLCPDLFVQGRRSHGIRARPDDLIFPQERTRLQMKSHSEVLRLRTATCDFGGTQSHASQK